MDDHRHATDRKETVVIIGCPNGCQTAELEAEGKDAPIDELVKTVLEAYDTCAGCGEAFGVLRRDDPTEVLK